MDQQTCKKEKRKKNPGLDTDVGKLIALIDKPDTFRKMREPLLIENHQLNFFLFLFLSWNVSNLSAHRNQNRPGMTGNVLFGEETCHFIACWVISEREFVRLNCKNTLFRKYVKQFSNVHIGVHKHSWRFQLTTCTSQDGWNLFQRFGLV